MPLQNSSDIPANAINSKLTYVPVFTQIPTMSASTGGVAAVTQGTTNIWTFGQYGAMFECFNNIATTAIAPSMSATAGNGLNIDTVTGAVSKIIELTEGNSVNAKNLFVARTSAPFYVQATFNVATLADVTDLFIGFRKQQAYQTSLISYTDYATFGVHSTAGHIQTQTQLSSGGNTVNDSGNVIVAATSFTIKVAVDGSGNVTYFYNGTAYVQAYQFAALNVIPFIWYATPAGGHAEVDVVSYQCGLQ